MTTPAGAVAANARGAQRDAEPRERTAPKGGTGFFQQKYGPLPGWGWAAVAAGGALVYFFWKSRKAATSAPGSTVTVTAATAATASTGYAGSISALQNEVSALQGQLQPTPGTAATTSKSTGPGTVTTAQTTSKTANSTSTAAPTGTVVVPNVVGMRANTAIGELTSQGFKYKGTFNRNPKLTYAVGSQSPSGGTSVAKGSTITLAWVQHTY
jgi:hypothetical protein